MCETTGVPSKPVAVIQLVKIHALTTEMPTTTDQNTADLSDLIEAEPSASAISPTPIATPTAQTGRPLKPLIRCAMPCGSAAMGCGGKMMTRSHATGPDIVA